MLHWVISETRAPHFKDINKYKILCRKSFELIVDYGGDINKTDRDGNTLLHYAVFDTHDRKSEDLIQFLLDQGVNPKIKNNYGKSALDNVLSARKGILESGTPIRSKHGQTAIVALKKNDRKVELLIGAGAGTMYQRWMYENDFEITRPAIILTDIFTFLLIYAPINFMLLLTLFLWLRLLRKKNRLSTWNKHTAQAASLSLVVLTILLAVLLNMNIPGLGYIYLGLMAYMTLFGVILTVIFTVVIHKFDKST